MRIPHASQHNFAVAPQAQLQRSKFNRSFNLKTTADAGKIIPLFWDEVLPGDTYYCKMTAFARFATLLFPLMDNVYIDYFYFFVPNRLVWDNWVKLCGEQVNPGDSINFTVPEMTSPVGGYATNSIYDYMGIPPLVAGIKHISLPLRGYNLIYNEWFRDENFFNSVPVNTTDSIDPDSNYILRPRGKRRDYFTSCLPWPQKGTAVPLPLGTTAPVIPDPADPVPRVYPSGFPANTGVIAIPPGAGNVSTNSLIFGATSSGVGNQPANWSDTGMIVDLASATAADINSLRRAFQIQRMLERDARGGTRYQELLVSHFKVHAPDQRLQRPEYLGGGTQMMNVTAIPQTAPTGTYGNTPQGNIAGIATLALQDHGFTRSFLEHGFIYGLISIRADLTYQQGLNRAWSRKTRYDYYWPTLAHLGEQAVLNKEIYAQGTAADDQVFGYQERYAEYRYFPSQISSLFRTVAAGTLDSWHLAQSFSTLPTLGATFINEDVPTSRVKAVPSQPDFIVDARVDMICAREMPLYSVPGMIDHF